MAILALETTGGERVPGWLEAGLWGLLAGGALVLGAATAWFVRVPPLVIASVMAFGSGVLISAVAFDLMAQAADTGGLLPTAIGFLGGTPAAARPSPSARCSTASPSPPSSGWPAHRGRGQPLVLAAVFISNIPEGMSSAAGMKASGRSARYVFGVWGSIALASGLAALLGYAALGGAPPELVAVITAVAAGAMLTMVADTMIPEAFERTAVWTGGITALGFLVAFAIDVAGT